MRILFLLYFLSFVGYLSAQKNTVELTIIDEHEKEDSFYYELHNGDEIGDLKRSPFRPWDFLIVQSIQKRTIRKILEEKYTKERDWVTYRSKKGEHLFYLQSIYHDTIFIPLNLQNDTTIYFDDIVDKNYYKDCTNTDTVFKLGNFKHFNLRLVDGEKLAAHISYAEPMGGCNLNGQGLYYHILEFRKKADNYILVKPYISGVVPYPKRIQKKYNTHSLASELIELEAICKRFSDQPLVYTEFRRPYEFSIFIRSGRKYANYKGYPASPTDVAFIFLFFEKYGAETCKIGR